MNFHKLEKWSFKNLMDNYLLVNLFINFTSSLTYHPNQVEFYNKLYLLKNKNINLNINILIPKK